MSRPRLVYAGHSYHVKTGSTAFLQDLLATRFDIVRIADDSWQLGRPPPDAAAINAEQPAVVVFFQLILQRKQLRQLNARNIVWIPMHDAVSYRGSRDRRYRGSAAKTLHFSASTERYFAQMGYETHRVQYSPAPAPAVVLPESPSVFFWIRRREVSWPLLKALLGPFRPARIVLRHAPDPGYPEPDMPGPEDVREYRIEIHHGWMASDLYADLRRSCQIVMQPRLVEGIGQAMLEALASGQAVISPDAPTMNEYIQHGHNGWLYDPARPTPLDFTDWRAMTVRAHQGAEEGFGRWCSSRAALLDFVGRPPRRRESLSWRLARRFT